MLSSSSSSPAPCESLGAFVRELRMRRCAWARHTSGPDLTSGLPLEDAHAFVAALCAIGYAIDVSDYLAIEAGEQLPSDPSRFIDVFTRCLRLSRQDWLALLGEVAFAILCHEADEEIAAYVLPGREKKANVQS